MLQDVRHALRSFAKRPSSALLSVAVFALAVGANATVFSAFNGFLLRPLPYPDDDRLVMIYDSLPKIGVMDGGASIPGYLDWRTDAPALEEAAIFAASSRTLRHSEGPERIAVTRASPSLFAVLGVAPALGRAFAEDEAVPGDDRVIMLSYRLWRMRFGGRTDIVGQTVRLDDELLRVVGVMPEGFGFPNRDVDAWVPFAYTSAQAADDRRFQGLSSSVGRLRPEATFAGLSAELESIARRNVERLPQLASFAEATEYTVRARPLRDYVVGELEQRLLVLQGLVLAVLLIACANVANLQLSRLLRRRPELAVRAALGAGTRRLARLIVVESALLALAGAGVGLALAYGALQVVRALGLERARDGFELTLDPVVLVVTLGGALVAAFLSVLLPLSLLMRGDLAPTVQERGRSSTGPITTRRWRSGLVVVQLAAALALLAGAGLLMKSYYDLQGQGPGFHPAGVWSAAVTLPPTRYADDDARARFFELTLAELRSLPGVDAAGFTTALPFSGENSGATVIIDGYATDAGPPPASQLRSINEDYFAALGIPILRGRNFLANEAERVAIVDESFARAYWPDGDALGKRVRKGTDPQDNWYTVVGVVGHVKHESFLRDELEHTIYWHFSQKPEPSGMLVLRTALPTQSVTAPARAAVGRIDPGLALYDIAPMDVRVLRALGPQRASMVLTLGFAVIAAALAVIGVYGVIASTVAGRLGEIGVRMAIGAQPADVLAMVMKQGTRMVVAGLLIGAAGALALGRVLAARIPEIGAGDPVVLAAAALLLTSAALLASWFPARRAARVDPMQALRED